MRSISIDNLLILDSTVTDFSVDLPLQGLEAPDYRINTYSKPGEDGGVLSSIFYGYRLITMQGVIRSTTVSQYLANRRAFAAACAIKRDSTGQPQPTVLSFTDLDGSTYFVNAFPQQPVFAREQQMWANFQASFLAPDNNIYSSTQVTSGAISRPTGGGFVLPVILPIVSAGTTGGAGSVNNTGTAASYPVLTLTGQLTNPYILNTTTGDFIQLNYTLAAGDTVVIGMAAKTIMLNGTTPLLSTKTLDSSWWAIEPGLNTILLNTGTSSDTGTVVVKLYPAFTGI